MMIRTRNRTVLIALIAVLAGLGVIERKLERTAAAQAKPGVVAPRFEVDPLWPKPLPNKWVLGQVIGVTVDAQDHVWIVHRDNLLGANEAAASQNPPTASCCVKAPPVLEFDPAGNVVGHWGGPAEGYDWPASNHGIVIDHKDNVWIGANEGTDAHVLKFTKAGKFLMQFGKPGQSKGSLDTQNFGRPAKIFVDAKTNEAYIADGYGNRRVVVIDADTGKFKRFWGAYGNKPDDTNPGPYDPNAPVAQQFRTPVHCAELSNDGLVYVCDRPNDRIQIFKPDGTFVKEVFVAKNTLGDGSVWDIAFSKDPQQKYLYLADGKNEKIYVMLRETMEILTTFGAGGRQPGQFFAVHSIALDSKGNMYTVETYEGRRLQKFVYKGLAPVTKMDQGTVWPSLAVQEPPPTNDLPNPYTTVEHHFKMPAGRTWGSTSAVEIDRDGKSVWVGERCGANTCVNSTLDPVLKFDETGKLVKSFGAGMIASPHGIHVDRDGNVWITDWRDNKPQRGRGAPPDSPLPPPPATIIGHQVFKFSPDGKLLMTLGKAGGGREPDYFYGTNDVLVAPNGDIFVSEGHSSAEGSNARILKFDKAGKLLKVIGKFGKGPGEFDQPHALAMDSKGRLLVGDRSNNRIQILDQDGKYLAEWSQFSRPSGIAIDRDDNIYVADSESGSVEKTRGAWKRGIRIGSAKDGSVRWFIPDPDQNPPNTSAAEGVAVDRAGNIYGAEVGPKALKKYVKK